MATVGVGAPATSKSKEKKGKKTKQTEQLLVLLRFVGKVHFERTGEGERIGDCQRTSLQEIYWEIVPYPLAATTNTSIIICMAEQRRSS